MCVASPKLLTSSLVLHAGCKLARPEFVMDPGVFATLSGWCVIASECHTLVLIRIIHGESGGLGMLGAMPRSKDLVRVDPQ